MRGVACQGVAGRPGCRGPGKPCRPPDQPGPCEEVRRGGGEREAAAAGGAVAEGPGTEQGRTRGDGKSFRALGNDLRERGLKPAADPVVDEAFTGVEAQLGITAACRLSGRSRATHYRRLRPAPPRRVRAPQVQPSALTAEERAAFACRSGGAARQLAHVHTAHSPSSSTSSGSNCRGGGRSDPGGCRASQGRSRRHSSPGVSSACRPSRAASPARVPRSARTGPEGPGPARHTGRTGSPAAGSPVGGRAWGRDCAGVSSR